jgi:Cerato-platanin
MKLFNTLISAFALAVMPSIVAATRVSYDTTYDGFTTGLNVVACSDGPNGLLTKGYTTFGSLPSFPYIGGYSGIVWNSPNCGMCFYCALPITMIERIVLCP